MSVRRSLLTSSVLWIARPWLWQLRGISKQDLAENPVAEFRKWFRMAHRCILLEFPEAMCVATCGKDNLPDSRMVLLKSFDDEGFVFYTNTLSRKGHALSENPYAALTFYWEPLQRQVRIQGKAELVSPQEADEYFATRPRLSKLGAWASQQSEPIENRQILDQRLSTVDDEYRHTHIPRPPHWCGYRVVPFRFEFWKLRAGRLHDRFCYELTDKVALNDEGRWRLTRLSP